MNWKLANIIALLTLTSFVVEAQYFNHTNSWKKRRKEYSIGGGATNYMGDLGGLDRKGTNWFLFDLEISQFKYGFSGSYRYNYSHRHATSMSLFYGKFTGSDQLTGDPYRNYRNLSFTTHLLELSLLYEFFLIRPQPGHIYDLKGARGLKPQKWDFYPFFGIGIFYYEPMVQGKFARYVGTEGQGLPGQRPYYNLVALSFPVGLGGAYHISKSLKIGMDMSYRWTTTDYIDDVSGNYFGKEEMTAARGATAAALSDPSSGENPSWTAAGQQRGNPKFRDGFMSVQLKVTFMPEKKVKNNGPRGRKSVDHFTRKGKRKLFNKRKTK